MKIGLSLSLCVKDIIEGRVALSDVTVIVSNTAFPDDDAGWAHMFTYHRKGYWYNNPDTARSVLAYLRANGMLIQPRLDNPHYGHKSNPHWIDVQSIDRFIYRTDPRS